MKKQVAIYARVSTGEQTPNNQLKELRAVARRIKWMIVEEFVDHGISGAKDRDQRPAYDRMYKAIVRRDVDLIMAWSVVVLDVRYNIWSVCYQIYKPSTLICICISKV